MQDALSRPSRAHPVAMSPMNVARARTGTPVPKPRSAWTPRRTMREAAAVSRGQAREQAGLTETTRRIWLRVGAAQSLDGDVLLSAGRPQSEGIHDADCAVGESDPPAAAEGRAMSGDPGDPGLLRPTG